MYDLDGTPPSVSWRGIRNLRARPPGNGGGARHKTLATALEQAEQLFAAAAGVDAAARPLVMFYGLSQAGRAIAAARAELGAAWTYRGHGLRETPGANSHSTTVADFEIQPHGHGAFNVVAGALGSSTFAGTTRLGDIWPLAPEASRFPLPQAGTHRLLRFDSDLFDTRATLIGGQLRTLPSHLVSDYRGADTQTNVRAVERKERERIEVFLGRYPSLAGYAFNTDGDERVGLYSHDLQIYNDGSAGLLVKWPVPTDGTTSATALRNRLAVTYYGSTYAYPCLDGSGQALHPLVVWWGLLFGLSVLARYEPQSWGKAINVNSSAEAASIEHLMDSGLNTLPELILRTMLGDA